MAARTAHILVVDDDPNNLTLVAQRLHAEGLSCVLVETGGAGIERVRDQRFDAVLLDLKLPDMDGLAVLDVIRAAAADVPVIVMTAHGSAGLAQQVLASGAAAYLLKPVRRRELIDTLSGALEASGRVWHNALDGN